MSYPPPQQPVQKSKAGPIIAIIIGSLPTDFPTGNGEKTGSHKVLYEISGSGGDLGTRRRQWGQDTETVTLPWSKEITVERDNFGAQVFAFPKGKDTNLESCRITIDGTEKKKANFANNTLICSYVYTS